jgi:hypothetical protein
MKTATAEVPTKITRVENDAKADFRNQEKERTQKLIQGCRNLQGKRLGGALYL